MTLSTTDASVLIRPNIDGAPSDITNRHTDFLDFMRAQGRVRPWEGGGNTRKWNVTYDGNGSAELFSEGQAAPPPGKRSFAQAQVSPWYAQASCAITGRVRDLIRQGGLFEDALDGELQDAIKALLYLCETTLVGSAQDKGLASIIDASDTYAGLAPGSYSLWASYEQGSIGAPAVGDFNDLYVSVTGGSRMGDLSVILTNVNQLRNYGDLQGPAATTSIMRMAAPGEKVYDLGTMRPGFSFNGAPLVPVRSITNTELYGLDFVNDDPAIYMFRDIETRQLGVRSDDDEFMVSTGMALIVKNRKVHGKLTGITA